MASIVRSILDGEWTNDSPEWSNRWDYNDGANTITPYARAVQTAEAFIHLAEQWNPRFDADRFLVACGLADAKVRKVRT
jgi:hypothetical protein